MAELIDSWAREQISKLWGFVREHATDYWGPDKSNGRRSEIAETVDRLDALEADQRDLRGELRHYLDAERLATCHGIAALTRHEDAHDQEVEEGTEVKVAKIQSGWQGVAMIIGQALTLIGVLVMALK